MGVAGFQPQIVVALAWSSTIQGMSNGRAACHPARRCVRAEASGAPVAQLFQRHRRRAAAGEIHEPVGHAHFQRGELFFQQRQKVARMQAVAHLVAVAAEPEVLERPFPQPRVDQ